MVERKFLIWVLSLTVYLFLALNSSGEEQAVSITEDEKYFTLANGIVSAKVHKEKGNIESLIYQGKELMGRGGCYWNIYGKVPGQKSTQTKGSRSKCTVSHDPSVNGGEIGEVTVAFKYEGKKNTVPLDIEIRYTLKKGDSGIYAWTIADHDPKYPAFNMEVSTACLKLNPKVFDFISIDEKMQRHMATAEDWVNGTQLNLWEARRLNTGKRKGEVEHKYDYNAMYSKTPAWGWSSTKEKIGLYVVNPSIEYINGSAVQTEYGAHIDVKASLPADPTLLFIWHSPHYGGRPVQIKENEKWRKVVGPFFLYCNSGKEPKELWQDSMKKAVIEKKSFPYEWAIADGFEYKHERGSAVGQLQVKDPQNAKATSEGAWIGLAHEPYTAQFGNKKTITIDWQTDGKHYQYWAQVNKDGSFTIPNVRSGKYNLYAFNDGVLGTFIREGVTVEKGKISKLGKMSWTPKRYGKQIWEIGVPNRSAEEFRHGDNYRQWGLYKLYPKEFPQGVDFQIGKSNWRTDWNYAQPPIEESKGRWKGSTWKIRFDYDNKVSGLATLRLAICASRGGPVDIMLNGQKIGTSGDLPESGAMHRDGIRGATLVECNVNFDSKILKPQGNIIELYKHARAWHEGVLYDYVRLEVDENKK